METRTPPHSAIPTAETPLPPGPAVSHPRGTGESFEALRGREDEEGYGLEDAGPAGLARRAYDSGAQAFENGARHSRQWARRHPVQLWGAVGALGLIALWMSWRSAQTGAGDAGESPRERADRLNP
jgi:hypothetical protein